MYKLQFVNTYTQEILREIDYERQDKIFEVINDMEKIKEQGLECFLLDSQQRTLACEFVYYSKHEEDGITYYKMFYKTRLAPVQAKIRG